MGKEHALLLCFLVITLAWQRNTNHRLSHSLVQKVKLWENAVETLKALQGFSTEAIMKDAYEQR